MSFSGYQCIACGAEQASDLAGMICPACGGNLDVLYDYAAAARELDGRFPVGEDLFRYRRLLPLDPRDGPFPLRIGQTPMVSSSRLGAVAGLDRVYLKDDSLLPSASFKDRAGVVAVCRAQDVGAPVIATASTGNAGASLACLAAAVGMRCVIFVPASAPAAKLAQLLIFGATVLAVRGTYDDAFDLCTEICDVRGWFNRSTGRNPFTREGKKTCSYEIWEDLGGEAPDWIAVSTGDGNILSGIWKGWRDLRALGWTDRLPRMLCVQSEESAAVTNAVRAYVPGTDWSGVPIEPVRSTTRADSISVDVPRDGLAAVRAVVESGGAAIAVPDADLVAAVPEIARATGVFAEPSAAAAWAGVKAFAQQQRLEPDARVVCLVSGSGLKDVACAREAAGEPMVIDPTVDAVEAALDAMGLPTCA